MARDKLIKVRRGTAAAWTSANPTLAAGEPGLETDTGKFKWGDGTTAWSSLAYAGGGAGVTYGTPAIVLGTSAAAGSTDESIRRDATIVAFDATAPTTQAFGDSAATGSAAVAARRDHKHAMPAAPTDASLSTSDITTNDVSTSKHGFTPKAPNDTAKYLRGDGTWATIGGTGTALVASDPIWDAKGDLAAGTGADAASRVAVGANGTLLMADSAQTPGVKWAPGIGMPELIYRYTVTGSDKASIDTGADTADAGSNDWTAGDLLEVWLYARTDETIATSPIALIFNNDSGSNYNENVLRVGNTTPSGIASVARANISVNLPGASATASVFGSLRLTAPNYAGTVGFKTGDATSSSPDNTAANMETWLTGWEWRNTAAITRVAVSVITAAKKFKVGTQLLIYKRRSA